MRTRAVTKTTAGFAVLAALLAVALPDSASASWRQHHHHGPWFNHGLTIAANPHPITAGQGVLIYGQLKGPNNAHKRIWLFHRINPASRFTPVSVTRTNRQGFYDFVRADGVVVSNRNWFVLGPRDTHSRTIHELVSAVVTLNASSASATTAQPVTFTGTVYPTHRHQRVLLQQQNSTSGTGWQTVASGYTDDELDRWAKRIRSWSAGREPRGAVKAVVGKLNPGPKRDVYVYFDNDIHSHAPHDAMNLAKKLGVKWDKS